MKKILRTADAAEGGSPPKPETPAQKIERLEAEIAGYKKADAERSAEEKLIADKVGKGLTREQAIAVIQRQKDHDQALAEKKAARLPRLNEIIKSNPNRAAARKAARAEFPDMDGSEFNEALKAK
jgi:hypothetical protein